jgi:hypothetical protein
VTLEEIRLYIIYEMEDKLIQLSKLSASTGNTKKNEKNTTKKKSALQPPQAILLHMCPHTPTYVFAYCYMCPHTPTYVPAYCHRCVRILH